MENPFTNLAQVWKANKHSCLLYVKTHWLLSLQPLASHMFVWQHRCKQNCADREGVDVKLIWTLEINVFMLTGTHARTHTFARHLASKQVAPSTFAFPNFLFLNLLLSLFQQFHNNFSLRHIPIPVRRIFQFIVKGIILDSTFVY